MIGKTLSSCLVLLLAFSCCFISVADAFCYRKNPPRSQENAELLQQPGNYSIFVCVQSVDYVTDLQMAPVNNTTQVWFSMSKIEKLKSNSFAKLAKKLVKVEIWSSKLAEIEDETFKGLKELKGLILPRNELKTVKSAWFKETPKLLELNLANNRIESIEVDFLKLLPALINLDLRGNDLVTIPPTFISGLPASLRILNLNNNPLNYLQMVQVAAWSKSKDGKTNESKLKELFNVTRNCMDRTPSTELNSENIDKCVENQMNNEITLIAANSSAIAAKG